MRTVGYGEPQRALLESAAIERLRETGYDVAFYGFEINWAVRRARTADLEILVKSDPNSDEFFRAAKKVFAHSRSRTGVWAVVIPDQRPYAVTSKRESAEEYTKEARAKGWRAELVYVHPNDAIVMFHHDRWEYYHDYYRRHGLASLVNLLNRDAGRYWGQKR